MLVLNKMLTNIKKKTNLKLKMRLPKILFSKKIFFLLIAVFILFFTARSALAYVPPSNSFSEGLKSEGWEKGSFDFTTINNIMQTISTDILGSPDQEVNNMLGSSAVGTVGSLIASLYSNQPASSVQYFADLGKNLNITKPAYAQTGIGYEGLRPILPTWKIFRNISYLLLTIILIAISFAIMFRLKINPQTVINIQNALPKIVITLILITFSYAIAGLIIDFIYVIIFFVFALFKTGTEINIYQNVFSLATNVFGTLGFAVKIGKAINELVAAVFSGLPGKILGTPVSILGAVIIAVAILFSLFKLFFSLLMSYISIIFAIIFSPLMIMFGAIPGQKGFSNWLKLILSNIIVFPVTALLFIIAKKIIVPEGGGALWLPPFLGSSETAESGNFISTLIAVGIIILIPSIIDSVKKAVGAKGMAEMAAGIVAPLAAAGRFAATPITYPISRAKAGMEKYYETQVAEGFKEGPISGLKRTFKPSAKFPEKS
jgi:hypothetical protein